MKSFKVVNPLIIGQLNTEYVAENGLDAASQFWNDISTHVTNNLPHTYVTLKDANNNLLHYKISEKLAGGSKVDFAIAEYDVKLSASDKKSFISKVESYEKKTLNKIKQTGGLTTAKKSSHPTKSKSSHKRRGSSSSSSSSDSDDDFDFAAYRRRLMQPISMWYYSPTLYGVNSIFIPTFNAPVIPYVKLWLPM
jgi:hypothetical protein